MRKHEQIVHLFRHPTKITREKKKRRIFFSAMTENVRFFFSLQISELNLQYDERHDLWLLHDVDEEHI